MDGTHAVILCLCALIVAILLYQQQRSFRGFTAVHKRAEKIVDSGVDATTSYEQFKSRTGGGDAVEYGITKQLAKNGSLNTASLAANLAPYAASY